MNLSKLAVIVTLSAFASAANAIPVLWSSEDGGNDHWYDIVTNEIDNGSAEPINLGFTIGQAVSDSFTQTFDEEQGYLATITSAEEQAFLDAAFDVDGFLWFGAFRDNMTDTTLSFVGPEAGQILAFENYADGQPEVSLGPIGLIALDGGTGEWFSAGDTDRNSYIVEYGTSLPAVPLPAGLPLAASAFGLIAFMKRRKKTA